jgi:prepilin-type processing-associated H-X9-DG protein
MKLRFSHQRNQALTRTEAIVVIATLAVLFVLLLPALVTIGHNGRQRINCISNLKQIGIAYRLWEGDNNGKYPMAVSVTNGGAMELLATGNVAACFQVMSNELSTPKILFCPEDTRRVRATNFSTGFDNSHISYFVGLDADESNPQMFLSGDDTVAIGGVPVKSGLLELSTNTSLAWTSGRHVAYNSHFWTTARHKFVGNIGMADGSAQQVTTDGLQKALQQTGVATNRLVLP